MGHYAEQRQKDIEEKDAEDKAKFLAMSKLCIEDTDRAKLDAYADEESRLWKEAWAKNRASEQLQKEIADKDAELDKREVDKGVLASDKDKAKHQKDVEEKAARDKQEVDKGVLAAWKEAWDEQETWGKSAEDIEVSSADKAKHLKDMEEAKLWKEAWEKRTAEREQVIAAARQQKPREFLASDKVLGQKVTAAPYVPLAPMPEDMDKALSTWKDLPEWTEDTKPIIEEWPQYAACAQLAKAKFATKPKDPLAKTKANKYMHKVVGRLTDTATTESYIDVYAVLEGFGVTNQATGHAIKKLLCGGDRGYKCIVQDYKEAISSLKRAIQLEEDKKNKVV